MKKSEIRKKILKIRKLRYSNNLKINFKTILSVISKSQINGKIIGGYYPFNYELDIMQILKKFEKKKFKISLPKVRSNYQMNFFKWSSDDPLTINKYGIPEPISRNINYPDIILVPLVAFDDFKNRIGYGGGFYDRYIQKIKKKKRILTIGLACSFQKVKKIPVGRYDVKLDFIITENQII